MAAMASSSPIPRLLSLPLPSSSKPYYCNSPHPHLHRRTRTRVVAVTASLPDDVDVLPVRSADPTDQQQPGRIEEEPSAATTTSSQVVDIGGLAFQGGAAAPAAGGGGGGGSITSEAVDRAINAAIVLFAGTYALTKLLTVDHDYWHGWTIYEILRYAPLHNWTAYEEALRTNPVLAKMMISGVVYSLGDWIAQCYEGKPLFEFDRARMFRSGLVGFTLHGSLSHYYYHLCEALFPFKDWWVVPAKVAFDQTAWSAFWNSIYYVVLGFLRFESPASIFGELRSTFWPMLTAGWKLWPFAHLITYGVIPVEQRLLWVDCVELIWVTILSTYSNEKSEARNSEGASQSLTSQSTASKDNSR